jgi:DNA oxidative demethylase
MNQPDLFALPAKESIACGAFLLRAFAIPIQQDILVALKTVTAAAPFRNMVTPGGFTMSVAMTSCGDVGWVADCSGYGYATTDPTTGRTWPGMPDRFRSLAESAAAEAGYPDFAPDSCLVNRYRPGTRLSLHQDKDERDFTQPIVSVALGLPATFLFGGLERSDPTVKLALRHGDVVIWGGPSRLRYHGVAPLKDGEHPALGACRVNLTFRRAL